MLAVDYDALARQAVLNLLDRQHAAIRFEIAACSRIGHFSNYPVASTPTTSPTPGEN